MAGRIRTLKPEWLEDETLACLSDTARLLFIAGLSLADDHGNLRASPAYLLGAVWWGHAPYRGVEEAVTELTAAGLWVLYSASGQSYAHIEGWNKHQRIDNANEPRLPLPPGWEVVEVTKVEGNRVRTRWESRLVGNGAAPTSTTSHLGPPPPAAPIPPRGDLGDLGPPDHDHDHDHDHEGEGAQAAPTRTKPTGKSAGEVYDVLSSFAWLTDATDLADSCAKLGGKLDGMPKEERWSDLKAEVEGWADHARKAFFSAKERGEPWMADRTLAEVVTKGNQRIRYRPKDARLERERERTRATTWPDGKAKSPAALETHDLDAEIAEAERRLEADRKKRASEPKVDQAKMAELTAKVAAGFKRGAA